MQGRTAAVRQPAMLAALWMCGALLSFMAMAVAGRELSVAIGTFQLLFLRSVVGLVVVAAIIGRRSPSLALTRRLPLQLLRNAVHFVGQYGWFYAIALIPLAEVFAIEFTTPVWTALLAIVLLGERLTRARMLAIGMGLLGMVLILRPGLAVVSPASLAVLGCAFCYALTHILTKKLSTTDAPLTIVFWMTLVQMPLGLVLALPQWQTLPTVLWPWVLVVGLAGLSAHYCMTRALMLADATVVVPMDFLRLPLIALVGFTFYGESLDWFVLAGATVMMVGNLASIRAERKPAVPSPGAGR